MPPFESSLPIFTTMHRFNGSLLLSIGLELVYGKDSTLGNVPTERPSYPAECNPWKIFNHELRAGVDNARVAGCFKKGAWGRMQEAGVFMLGSTEFMYRCIYDTGGTTRSHLAEVLKKITYDGDAPWTQYVHCKVLPYCPDFPRRSPGEYINYFNVRARPFMRHTEKYCNSAMAKVGIAFNSSLHVFGSAFSPKRGVEGSKVPLCKLEKKFQQTRWICCDGEYWMTSSLRREKDLSSMRIF